MTQEIAISNNWKKPFFLIWTGQSFSLIGSMLVQFALVWWMTEKTGSAAVLATATVISILPQILLGPFAGALVDRWNRKRVMIVADGVTALATLVLVFLFWSGKIQVWHLYVAEFVRALGGTFHWPAMSASTSLMVPEKHLSRIAGVNQAMQGVLGIIAPPLGAFLMGLLPIYSVLAIDIVTAMMAILPLSLVHIPQPSKKLEGVVSPRQLFRDVREGLRYLASWPGMIILLGMATMINMLFNPAFSLLPLMITRIFKGGAMQLGVINSAWGAGVILGGLVLGAWGGFRRKIYTSMTGIIGMSLGTMLLASAPASMFFMAMAGMALSGFMNPITNGPLFALLQTRIRPEMQGRVFTLVSSLAAAASPVGLALAAPVADLLGIRFWFYIAGGVSLLMGVAGFLIPAVRTLDDLPTVQGSDEAQEPALVPVQVTPSD
ncbi:MAG TPA: MFS transporter [Anaerolinea thermolimosa]|uniref:Multidrug efflux pump Tap n=1 Tax=Anaerolinea thermolimosa TaxID=229919 RepID=A0A3D1JGA9_9CHLR|nr:MFS transporter [Anaerolinea thermolimosa]GAP07639.1 arabinose efflux permease [Anaerolinea thermolimosa]HCE16636.1 MFS transporter [Anaerolinea thermolimosa]